MRKRRRFAMIETSLNQREAARIGIQKTAGRMIGRYVIALSLIAMLSLTAFVGTRLIIQEQDESSTVISISGRQRTLSQQVASAVLHMVAAEDAGVRRRALARLRRAVIAMQNTHRALVSGDEYLNISPETRQELKAMFFDPPIELSSKVSDFLLSAAHLASLPVEELVLDHPDVQAVLSAASGSLLQALDEATRRYEAAARDQVDTLRQAELAIFLTTLVVLLLEALFIFRPMAVRLRQEASRFLDSQDALERMAHHDSLTGLVNRTLFRSHLALARARRDGTLTAVLQLDLDHFKDVNDTLGHPAGDHLLSEIARRLKQVLRASDTVARLGGDEFALILNGLETPLQVAPVAEKIVAALSRPVGYGTHTIHTSASIGITLYPTDGGGPEQLLKNADIALYEAKGRGRNTFAFFIDEMKDRVERRAQIEADLREALAKDQFELRYQPILRVRDRQVVGLEALLRWRHPDRGLLAPGDFLSVAEDTGLIVPIGFAMLSRAGRLLQSLDEHADLPPLNLAVNLAAAQLRTPGFLETFSTLLGEAGVAPERVEVEIAEDVMFGRGREKIAHVLDQLRHRGVRLALDDFGTGQASLTQLKHLKIDRLKIDRSFVNDIGTDPSAASIVRAVINLGHSLDLEVSAKGVESEDQLAFLRLHGCDLGQGYELGPPVAEQDLVSSLRRLGAQGERAALQLT